MKRTLIAALALSLVVAVAQGVCAQPGVQPNQPARPNAAPGPGEGPAHPIFLPRSPMLAGRQCTAMVLALPPGPILDMHREQLQITDQQKTKIREALDKAEQTLRPLRDQSAEKGRVLRDALFVSGSETSNLRSLTDAALKAETAVANAELTAWNELRTILSAEQLKKLGEMIGGPGLPPPLPNPPRPPDNMPPPPPPPSQ